MGARRRKGGVEGGRRSLRDLLGPRVVIPLPAGSLDDAVDRLAVVLAERTADPEPLMDQLRGAEADAVVPLGQSALLLHVRSDLVPEVRMALGVADRPFDFSPETARGARVLVIVVSPTSGTRAYLQTLAALGRVLRRKEVAERLGSATSAREVLSIPALGERVLGEELLVRDVMTSDVVSISLDATLAEAADLMIRLRLRALPVVNERREVMGMITDRQVMEHFLPRMGMADEAEDRGEGAGRRAVREVMQRSVMCLKEEESLRDVAALMINKDVERFPVCAEGELVGFLSRGDIIRRLLDPRALRRSRSGADREAAGEGGD